MGSGLKSRCVGRVYGAPDDGFMRPKYVELRIHQ